MGYITGGLAGLAVLGAIGCWFLWGQLGDEKVKNGQLQATIAVQTKTIEATAAQVAIAKTTLEEQRQANVDLSIKMQERAHVLNDLRLTIQQQAYESPYRNSVDLHNWIADWMRGIEGATSGDPARADHHPAVEPGTDPVPAGTD